MIEGEVSGSGPRAPGPQLGMAELGCNNSWVMLGL